MDDHLNNAVLTTKYIFFEGKPIKCVFHHLDDGLWEFGGEENDLKDSDFVVVSLAEILVKDSSVGAVLDLPLGYYAHRESIFDNWNIAEID